MNFDRVKCYKILLGVILIFIFCISNLNAQYTLSLCNNNFKKIDSIILTNNDTSIVKSILPSVCKKFDIPNKWTNKHGIVMCNYKVYFGYNYVSGQKLKSKFNDTIYINNDIQHEPVITILINNVSNHNIDSIFVANRRVNNPINITPREKSIEVKYQDLVSNPLIEIEINKTKKSISLQRQDFADLRYPFVDLWLHDSLFLKGVPPFSSTKEVKFIFEPYVYGFSLENLNLASTALITEVEPSNKYRRIFVLDFDELKRRPFLKISIGKTKYKLKLTNEDLSHNNNGGKYFWVDKKSIKPMY
jgi:hypothetical protein